MIYGPGDFEIDEIGLDEIFEGVLPGSEVPTNDTNKESETETETETTNTGIDDPFGEY